MMFKWIISVGLTIASISGSLASAGEFKKIDEEVRRVVAAVYAKELNQPNLTMSYQDIWALKLEDLPQLRCDFVVSGLANKPITNPPTVYRFWVCVDRLGENYFGEILRDEPAE